MIQLCDVKSQPSSNFCNYFRELEKPAGSKLLYVKAFEMQ